MPRVGKSRRMPDRPSTPPSVWAVRAVWLVLPLAVGPALAAALDHRSAGVRGVGSTLAWGVWVGVLVASLVPRASSLTVLRVGAPGAVVAAAWAAGPGSPDDELLRGAVAVAAAALAAAVVAAPSVADAFVDGSSYGTERRFALRVPPALAVLATVTWVVVAAGVVTGPLLLGARQWVAGGLATVVGSAAAVAGVRSLHGLARRWVVFVPSGVVVHDPVGRPESVMAPRPLITRLAPAPADTDAVDLTLGAPGIAIELETSEPLPVTVRRRGRELGTEVTNRVVFTPTRAAAVLAEAEGRRLPVG